MPETRPSTFITVLAWLALIVSGLAGVTGLLQSAMVAYVMPATPMSAGDASEVPPFIVFLFDHFLGFVVVLTAMWAATFAFALGLLRRREWGRRGFIAILTLWCIITVTIAVFQQVMMRDMFGGAQAADTPAEAHTMILVMRIAGAIFAFLFTVTFGWLAWRLGSSRIRAEFS